MTNHVLDILFHFLLFWKCIKTQSRQAVVKSVILNTSNTNANNAVLSIERLVDVNVDNTNNEWDILCTGEDNYHLGINLDNSWGFHPTKVSTLAFTLYSSTQITNKDLDILVTFSVNNNQFITVFVRPDTTIDGTNLIGPASTCDTSTTPTEPLGTGNIKSCVDQSTCTLHNCSGSCDRRQHKTLMSNNGIGNKYSDMQPPLYYSNGEWPITITLVNDPINNYLFVRVTNPGWNQLYNECGFNSFSTNSGIQIYIGLDDPNERVSFTQFKIEYSYNLTLSPTSIPTTNIPTNFPTTNTPTTLDPTMIPTSHPSSQPTTHNPTTVSPTTYSPITIDPTTVSPTTYSPTVLSPTLEPTVEPTIEPTINPTTLTPTYIPTVYPTTLLPTILPSTLYPTHPPTLNPSIAPITPQPTIQLTIKEDTTTQMTPTTYIIVESTAISVTTTMDVYNESKDDQDFITKFRQHKLFWIIIGIAALFMFICICFTVMICKKRKKKNKKKDVRSQIRMSAVPSNTRDTHTKNTNTHKSEGSGYTVPMKHHTIDHSDDEYDGWTSDESNLTTKKFGQNLNNITGVNQVMMDDVIQEMDESKNDSKHITPNIGRQSTFNNQLDNVVNTNNVLMSNVLNDMAVSQNNLHYVAVPKLNVPTIVQPPPPPNTKSLQSMYPPPPQTQLNNSNNMYGRNGDYYNQQNKHDYVNPNLVNLVGGVINNVNKSFVSISDTSDDDDDLNTDDSYDECTGDDDDDDDDYDDDYDDEEDTDDDSGIGFTIK